MVMWILVIYIIGIFGQSRIEADNGEDKNHNIACIVKRTLQS